MSGPGGEALREAYAAAEAEVRRYDRDRWLASLFIPADRRPHVLALQAYGVELARVRDLARDPMPGEIRLQWWIDAVEGRGHGDVTRHPVAAALIDTADKFQLPRSSLAAMAEARRFDLYDDPMPSLLDLEGYAGETASLLLQQAAIVVAGGTEAGTADASGHAGVAYAMTGLMRALPLHARRGQVYLPADVLARHGTNAASLRAAVATPAISAALAEMRSHTRHHLGRALASLASVDPNVRTVYVGLGLVEPYLAALERRSDPFSVVADVAVWRKPVALWRFARRLSGLGVGPA